MVPAQHLVPLLKLMKLAEAETIVTIHAVPSNTFFGMEAVPTLVTTHLNKNPKEEEFSVNTHAPIQLTSFIGTPAA